MRTLKFIGIAGSAVALLLSATIVFAKGEATSATEDNGNNQGALTSSATASLQSLRDAAQARVEKERVKAEDRLGEIEDKVKQGMAKSLAAQFDSLNAKWTDRFSALLDRYSAIVQKIQDRANIALAAGKDVAATTAAIQAANSAIASARTAVAAQAAKTFELTSASLPVTVTTTPKDQDRLVGSLRTSFKNINSALFKDLFALRDGPMKDARSAVKAALDTLSAIAGVDDDSASSTEKNDQ